MAVSAPSSGPSGGALTEVLYSFADLSLEAGW
jgi:hypothetical protein